MGPLAWLVVGLVAGFLASRVMKGRGSDLLGDLILGVVGAAVWVSAEAVHGVGEDAITINTEADARAASDAPEAVALVKAKRAVIGK